MVRAVGIFSNTELQKIQNILEVGRWLELPVKFTVGLMPELVGGAVAAVPVGTIILTSSTLKRSQEVSETKKKKMKHHKSRRYGWWQNLLFFFYKLLLCKCCLWILTLPSTFDLFVIIRDHDHCWISMHLKLPPQMREEWYSRLTQAQRRIEMVPRQALNSRRHQKCLPAKCSSVNAHTNVNLSPH